LDTDLFNLNKYTVETYKNSFLGSEGKRVGKYYSPVDDFDVIIPNESTEFTVEIESEDIITEGTFEDVFIYRENITPDNLLSRDSTAYGTYMSGNHSLVKIKNKNCVNNKKALVVIDSYGCVVVPYLSQAFKELDCIDIRFYSDSVEDYILEEKPDVVIYMISSYQQ
jgi:hypothetical protein